jgi:hypothetical protein
MLQRSFGRVGAGTFSAEQQRLTLLHEVIHLAYADGACRDRQERLDQLTAPHGNLRGRSDAERRFETQRLGLARRLYMFPEEVIAEKHLQVNYPELRATRLGYYARLHRETVDDVADAEPGLEWVVAFYDGLKAELGATLAADDAARRTRFEERARAFDNRLRELVGDERHALLARLRDRLLAVTLEPLQWDEDAAIELFELVVATPYPGSQGQR